MNHVAPGANPTRLLHLICSNPENWTAINLARRNDSRFGAGTGSRFTRSGWTPHFLGHENNIKHATRWKTRARRSNRSPGGIAQSVILPGMPRRSTVNPRIALVGAGNLAASLAVALHGGRFVIDTIISRAGGASLQRARRLANEVAASAAPASRVRIDSDVVWFCVPDSAIATAARSLTTAADWKGKVALHSSGALASDELGALRKLGAAVASVHPLMTFVRASRPRLSGVSFTIEGDATAVQVARAIVAGLGGRSYSIRKSEKAAYHAWGTFASPLLSALLAATERIAGVAGIHRKAARTRMLPILRQTLANYERLGAAQSFSGPIARGDLATVQRHLDTLKAVPEAREVYVSLAQSALRDLPAKNRAALREILRRK